MESKKSLTKKHVFFDLDGTLINFGGHVPDSAMNAIKQMRKNGHKALICSGRSISQVAPWMRENFDGLINSAGAVVSFENKIIYAHSVKCEDAAVLRKTMDAANAALVAQCDNTVYLSEKSLKMLTDYMLGIGKSEERVHDMFKDAVVTDTMEVCPTIRKYFYIGCEKTTAQLNSELGSLFNFEAASFGTDDPGCGEITCRGINKAYGMQKYLDYMGASPADTIAIGDGPNDLEMLGFAGTAVAMGNGVEAVKKLADFITKDIDDNGVEYALKTLGLI